MAVLAGFYLTKSGKNQNDKFKYKRQLLKLLLEDKITLKELNRNYLQKLFIFIDHILRLPKELESSIIQELKPIVMKEESIMGLDFASTSFGQYFLKEAEEEARLKGQKEGLEKGRQQKALEIATRLLIKGFSAEEIAEDTGLSLEKVLELKKSGNR